MALGSALGGLAGGIGILAGAGGKGGIKDLRKLRELWSKLETSDFDFSELSFPELQMVQELFPEVYDAVVPSQAETVQEDPAARDAQMRALARIEEISGEGLPLQDRIAAEYGTNALAQESRGHDLAVLRNLAARGGLASGDEGQLRMIASARAGNTARELGTALQEGALNRRVGAIGQTAAQSGAIRSGDFATRAFNADALNRFNMDVAGMQTQAARFGAEARGEANRYNVGTRQRLAEENALGRLGLAVNQQGREDELKSTLFGQNVEKLKGLSGVYGALANWRDRDRARKEQAIAGIGEGVGGLLDVGLLGTGGGGGGGGGFSGGVGF